MFKKIVWATDGSENADRALSIAKTLARENGASLAVVHIVQKYATKTGLAKYGDEGQVEAKLKQIVRNSLGRGSTPASKS